MSLLNSSNHLYEIVIYTFASLISIVNPLGMAPIFLELTQPYPPEIQHKIAYQVALYGVALLILALFIGPFVLRFFGISVPFVQIAGGCLVFFTAWGMLDIKPKISSVEEQEALRNTDITFFPLTMPITAGAGALAITISIASKLSVNFSFIDYLGVILGIIAVFLIVAICYRYAGSIFQRLGKTGTNVITRLSAFILLAIGVEIVWNGVKVLILSVK